MLPSIFRNNWLPTLFDDFFNNEIQQNAGRTLPAINVKENEDSYIMELAAPGIKKESCKINVDGDNNLCISIENKKECKDEKENRYIRREFSYENYEQKYSIPEDVEKEGISAKAEHGVLTIKLPKLKKEKEKKTKAIEIE
jgi:HSP20 family protein